MNQERDSSLPINLEEFIKRTQKDGDIENFASKLVQEYFNKINKCSKSAQTTRQDSSMMNF